MTTLIFGKDGQVGKALQSIFKEKSDIVFLGRENCDLANPIALNQILHQYQPRVIINTAAYTAVDRAEVEVDLAFNINAQAPKIMSEWISTQYQGLFIHYSTDYVFADTKQTPYNEDDTPGPIQRLGVYAKSKLAAENAIIDAFNQVNGSSAYYILRTSWLYGDGTNFIKTMLRLAQENESLSMVADQIGAPTSADFLAQITKELLFANSQPEQPLQSGIYDVVPQGYTSWYGLATFVIKIAEELGLPMKISSKDVLPIQTASYPLVATRPHNSRLSNEKLIKYLSSQVHQSPSLVLQDWQIDVEQYIRRMLQSH